MKPKEYLVSIGALPEGAERSRGRISKDNDALIRKHVSEKGVRVEGYSVSTAPRKPNEPVEIDKSKPSGEKTIVELAPYRYPEDQYRAFERDENGKKKYRSLREACRHSRLSLVGCPCDSHEIVSRDGTRNVRVWIEPKDGGSTD